MNIDRIREGMTPAHTPKKRQSTEKPGNGKQTRGDRLEISDEALKLHKKDSLLEVAKTQLANIPDIRQKKIEEIQGKLASNYYDNQDVIADIAGKMLDSEELRSAFVDENKEAVKASAEDVKKLSVVLNRIENKYYESPEVLKKVAEGIIKDLSGSS